jgi:hypothetical protein
MYMAAANEISKVKLFDTQKIAKVIAEYQEYMGNKA